MNSENNIYRRPPAAGGKASNLVVFLHGYGADGKDLIDLAKKLEGITRNAGKHAGGVVIAPGSISDFCPVYNDRQSASVMTQYDKDDVEKIGLVKFDFLGLRTLTVIDRAVKSINSSMKKNESLDLDKIPHNDSKVFELLSSGKTTQFRITSGLWFYDLLFPP